MFNYVITFKGNTYKYEKLCMSNGIDIDEEIDVFYTVTFTSSTSFMGNVISEGELITKRIYNEEE